MPKACCQICAETLNKTTRMPVQCVGCEFVCCRECLSTFLLEEAQPHCMNPECGVELTDDFLESNFTKVWMKEVWLPNRSKLTLDREKSRLQSTQYIVEILNGKEKTQETIQELYARRRELWEQMRAIDEEVRVHKIRVEDAEMALQGRRLMQSEGEKKQFVKKCPGDNCKGFLSTRWHCTLCGIHVCNKCHAIKTEGEDHECNPDDVESVKLLANDSKPCPKCSVMIHRYEGCMQCWCTQCHTGFDWRTLKIETGRIHNPHYFSWLREQEGGVPREEDRCDWGELIPLNPIRNQLEMIKPPPSTRVNQETGVSTPMWIEWQELSRNVYEAYRLMNHVRYDEMHRYRDDADANEMKKQSMRIKYLMNRISEENWLRELIVMEKVSKRKADYRALLEMLTQCMSDIFRQQVMNKQFDMNPINTLIRYYNPQMASLARKYGTKAIMLHEIY